MAFQLRDGYHTRTGCANCAHCYAISKYYDSQASLYCMSDGVSPPKLHDRQCRQTPEFTAWESGRSVEPTGICASYEAIFAEHLEKVNGV